MLHFQKLAFRDAESNSLHMTTAQVEWSIDFSSMENVASFLDLPWFSLKIKNNI